MMLMARAESNALSSQKRPDFIEICERAGISLLSEHKKAGLLVVPSDSPKSLRKINSPFVAPIRQPTNESPSPKGQSSENVNRSLPQSSKVHCCLKEPDPICSFPLITEIDYSNARTTGGLALAFKSPAN